MLCSSYAVLRLPVIGFLLAWVLPFGAVCASGLNKPHPAVSAQRAGVALTHPPAPPAVVVSPSSTFPEAASLSTGDLDALRRLGRLRVLVPERHSVHFPDRSGDEEEVLLDGLAQALNMSVERVPVSGQGEFAKRLLSGEGDLLIAPSPFGQRNSPPPGVSASVPLGKEVLTVVTRAGSVIGRLGGLESAFGRTISLPANSSVWTDVARLERKYPWVHFESAPPSLGLDGMARDLADGRIEATLLPQGEAEKLVARMPELAIAFGVGSPTPVAWYMRSGNPALVAAVNAYLEQHQVAYGPSKRYRADLAELRRLGVLRAIVRPDGEEFYLEDGAPSGLVYAELQALSAALGLRLDLKVAQSEAEARSWLDEGLGDLIATPSAQDDERLVSTLPYHYVAPVVVARAWSGLSRPEDLHGMRCLLPPDSPARVVIEQLSSELGITIEIVEEPRFQDRRKLLHAVIEDESSFTLVDGDRLPTAIAGYPDLRAAWSLVDQRRFRFTLRRSDRELLVASNDFLRERWPTQEHRSLVAAMRKPKAGKAHSLDLSRLSPFDELVQQSANAHGFDWRLIVSIMYQESQFDPRARSPHGALGLMQVLPSTAKAMGVRDLLEPRSAILAGVRYLDELRGAFPNDIAVRDRTWFAVAAYHAGPSRLEQARAAAQSLGLDPNRWFGHVEQAMEKLAAEDNASRVRRAVFQRTVRYVREVRERFDTYVRVAAPQFAAVPESDSAPRL